MSELSPLLVKTSSGKSRAAYDPASAEERDSSIGRIKQGLISSKCARFLDWFGSIIVGLDTMPMMQLARHLEVEDILYDHQTRYLRRILSYSGVVPVRSCDVTLSSTPRQE